MVGFIPQWNLVEFQILPNCLLGVVSTVKKSPAITAENHPPPNCYLYCKTLINTAFDTPLIKIRVVDFWAAKFPKREPANYLIWPYALFHEPSDLTHCLKMSQ